MNATPHSTQPAQASHHHGNHAEHHFSATDRVRNIVVGMADSLTVPFALAAGTTGASVVIDTMAQYGVRKEERAPMLAGLEHNPKAWRDFMMRFELGPEEQDPSAAKKSAGTIALPYLIGGPIPLAPYLFFRTPNTALAVSAGATLTALFIFVYFKGHSTGTGAVDPTFQTLAIGGLAAGAAFLLARLTS